MYIYRTFICIYTYTCTSARIALFMYTYVNLYVFVYMYIHIYRESEGEEPAPISTAYTAPRVPLSIIFSGVRASLYSIPSESMEVTTPTPTLYPADSNAESFKARKSLTKPPLPHPIQLISQLTWICYYYTLGYSFPLHSSPSSLTFISFVHIHNVDDIF
jgi:hypothetical protein